MKTRFIFSILFVISLSFSVNAQNGSLKTVRVKGTVTNAKGFPLSKVDVFADSLKTGFRTNKKGVFKLRIPVDTDVIGVFYEDYGLQREVYTGQEEINFTLTENSEAITEQELSKLGYIFDVDAFQNVGKEDYSKYSDIFQIIREKFTGVTVNSGTILVRGNNTWGDQTPLYIVNGNYVNTIVNINVDMLKSIELLKGEDTALYGARGANGVFIITLK